jgi:pimeloyl-ACP methyl ester carboxylesterase
LAEEFKRASLRMNLFESEEFDFQIIRGLGVACKGGATMGECLRTASRITDGDILSWVKEWTATAAEVEKQASDFLKKSIRSGARDTYLRASMYWRAAEYYGFFSEPGRRKHYESSARCFREAAGLTDLNWEMLEIPFQDIELPGYFFSPSDGDKPRPTLMLLSGFDGTMEEGYFGMGSYALEEGCNVMMFEGPGQAAMCHLYPDRPFMPDFEKPVSAAVDYALSRADVDSDRLALFGLSLGGYFAARGALHDKRIKACILDSPIVNMHDYFSGSPLYNLIELPESEYEAVKQAMPLFRWAVETFGRRFGASTIAGIFEKMEAFNIEGQEKGITCATLSLIGEGEGQEAIKQTDQFYQNVSGPRTKRIFTAAEGADAHCQVGNLPLACSEALAWLKKIDWGSGK